jgi:hypothetical protein
MTPEELDRDRREPLNKADYLLSPCPSCGHPNPPSETCGHCGAKLTRSLRARPAPPMFAQYYYPLSQTLYGRDRPGCVILYVMVLSFVAQVVGLAGLFGLEPFEDRVGIRIAAVLYAAFNLVVAMGLWSMKGWARIVNIALSSLSAIGLLASLFSGDGVAILGLLVEGITIWWFASHGEYFD